MMTKLKYLAKYNLPVPLYRNNFMYHDDPKTRVCALYLELLAKVSEHQPDSDEIHLNKQKKMMFIMTCWKCGKQPI
jgi:hypothetical protein